MFQWRSQGRGKAGAATRARAHHGAKGLGQPRRALRAHVLRVHLTRARRLAGARARRQEVDEDASLTPEEQARRRDRYSFDARTEAVALELHKAAAELARQLFVATNGQPLYLEQAVQVMVASGAIEARDSRLVWSDGAMSVPTPEAARMAAERRCTSSWSLPSPSSAKTYIPHEPTYAFRRLPVDTGVQGAHPAWRHKRHPVYPFTPVLHAAHCAFVQCFLVRC